MGECTLLLQKQGKPYPRTCPTCGIAGPCQYKAAVEAVGNAATPKLGEKSTCSFCGKIIEYIGPYWHHIGAEPRHEARPFYFDAAVESVKTVEAAQNVENEVSPELIAETVAMVRLKRAAGDLLAACEAWEKVERLQTRAALHLWDGIAVDELQSALMEAKRLTYTALSKARGGRE